VLAERSSSYGGDRGKRSSRARCTEKKRARRTVAGEEGLGGVAGEEGLGGVAGEEALGGVRRRRRSGPEKEAVGELLGSVAAAVGALLGYGGGGGAPGLGRGRG